MMQFRYILCFLFIAIIGCKKPYNPPVITAQGSYLVVEGVINAGSGTTVIKLSRTVNLSSARIANPESDAIVTIESDQNTVYQLFQSRPGYYATGGLNLDQTRKYHLRIKTANNQQYLSDFAEVKVTPPIDSVGFALQANGMQLYVNTHDPANNTHYYRWDYDETWQFHAKYASNYISNGTAIVGRTADQYTYFCFANDTSSSIILGSSAKLKQDVIFQNPITAIASTSEKVEIKYSIQLHQYALTGDAYTFWENIKKNTEQLGSIFDAEPSSIKGNIHNVNNPAEAVIGYVSVCDVQTKRIFISNDQVPSSWNALDPAACGLDSMLYCHGPNCQNDVALFLLPPGSAEIPVSELPVGARNPIGYLSASVNCTDCTLRGTKTQPVFWK